MFSPRDLASLDMYHTVIVPQHPREIWYQYKQDASFASVTFFTNADFVNWLEQ